MKPACTLAARMREFVASAAQSRRWRSTARSQHLLVVVLALATRPVNATPTQVELGKAYGFTSAVKVDVEIRCKKSCLFFGFFCDDPPTPSIAASLLFAGVVVPVRIQAPSPAESLLVYARRDQGLRSPVSGSAIVDRSDLPVGWAAIYGPNHEQRRQAIKAEAERKTGRTCKIGDEVRMTYDETQRALQPTQD